MNVAIIVFSPSGNTLKVANMLKKHLEMKNIEVQIVNITGNESIFSTHSLQQFLQTHVAEHDVLCIGSPVYAHHLQYYVKDVMTSLPAAENGWGKFAIPFVTYGGTTSGIALEEAGKLLKKSGRIVVAGMKICASHRMTRAFLDEEYNAGKPGDEVLPVIEELAQRIEMLKSQKNAIDHSEALTYQTRTFFIKANVIFREKLWHKYMYPRVLLDQKQCTQCGKCVRNCSVQHFEKHDDGTILTKETPACIHCFNCVAGCPVKALSLSGDIEKAKEFMGKKIQQPKENPLSAVYPIGVMA
jgi:ferredoxin